MVRWRLVPVFVSLLTAATLATPTADAPASPVLLSGGTVFQFNTFGNSGPGKHFNAPIAQDVLNSVDARSPMPFAIALEEMCFPTVASLAASTGLRAPSRNYTAINWYLPVSVGTNPDGTYCGSFGNFVAIRGTATGSPDLGQYSVQSGEIRSWICLAISSTSPYRLVCSTHLKNSDVTTASWQLFEFLGHLNLFLLRQMWGADLNLNSIPGQPDYASGLGTTFCNYGFVEAELGVCSPVGQTSTMMKSPPRKYDYGGFKTPGFTVSPPPRINASAHSDHRILEGFAS